VAGRPTTTVRVIYKGVPGTPVTYNVLPAAPGIYTLNQQGNGPGAILNQDYSGNTPAHPEKKGNVVAIYMTGEGVIPGNVTGAIATTVKNLPAPPTATIGGVSAPVIFAGTSPGIINGVLQVNVAIPDNAPSGQQALVLTFGNSPTQAGVTVSVAP
jgi:uncharacterized protein (TIGR03437 family)